MLGGDSINKNGGIQYFTKKQAKILAYEVLTLQKKNPSFLLITNGPRTGKYNEKTDKKTTAHSKSKIHKTCDIDEISKTFLNELRKNELQNKKNWLFFNFCFKEKSLYKALLGSLIFYSKKNKSKSNLILPAESISMLSEASSIFSKFQDIKVMSYETSAMNPEHKAFLDELLSLSCVDGKIANSKVKSVRNSSFSSSPNIKKISKCHSAEKKISIEVYKRLLHFKLLEP